MPSARETTNADFLIGATDQLEQAAAELARKKGHPQITNDDRREAYDQLRKTAPPARSGPPTPEQG